MVERNGDKAPRTEGVADNEGRLVIDSVACLRCREKRVRFLRLQISLDRNDDSSVLAKYPAAWPQGAETGCNRGSCAPKVQRPCEAYHAPAKCAGAPATKQRQEASLLDTMLWFSIRPIRITTSQPSSTTSTIRLLRPKSSVSVGWSRVKPDKSGAISADAKGNGSVHSKAAGHLNSLDRRSRFGFLDFCQDAFRALQIPSSRFGECEFAGRAVEKPDPQSFLKGNHVLGRHRLRHPERPRCPRQTS